jgi:hypothetical protein
MKGSVMGRSILLWLLARIMQRFDGYGALGAALV